MKEIRELVATYRTTGNKVPISGKLSNSKEVAEILRKIFPVDIEIKESFIALFLNTNNVIDSYYIVSIGGIQATIVDLRCLFQAALLSNCTAIIIAHNHPSGNLSPSREDDRITKKISEASTLLGYRFLDHIIISKDSHYSYNDNGKNY